MAEKVRTTLFWEDEPSGTINIVEFDAVVGLSPEDLSVLTSHPVEHGSNVTDHVRDEPTHLSIEAVVSNTPRLEDPDAAQSELDIQVLGVTTGKQTTVALQIPSPPIQPDPAGLVTAGVNAIGAAITGGPKATVNERGEAKALSFQAQAVQQTSPRNRIRDVYDALLGAKEVRALVSVTTRDRDFFDMIITRVAAPRAAGEGATRFEVELEQLRVAESQTVSSPKPAEIRGAKAKNKGSQTTKESKNATQIESTLFQGGEALGLIG